jgi:UDPglucose--hexose-1-phosphate uridylyltransferase
VSELRWNPLLGEWVVTATHRQERTFHPPADFCPLCPTLSGGFETEIPVPAYDVAVFENKFPSFRSDPARPAVRGATPYNVEPARGVCEVVVYSPHHDSTLANESEEQIYKLVQVWADRYRVLGSRPEIKYVFIFENKGEAIGVTLSHPHGQIYAFPYVPPIPARELRNMQRYWRGRRRCLMCDLARRERRMAQRVIYENDHFMALVPFFARYPYEVHIWPRRHVRDLLELKLAEQKALANILKRVTSGYDKLFAFSFPYMMLLHQRPTDGAAYRHFHFHIEFLPPYRTRDKLKYLAGCESGAGTFIVDALAEETAAELRAAVRRANGDEQ